jgi:hypothetical protein
MFAAVGANGHDKNSSEFFELQNHEVVRHEKILKESSDCRTTKW